MRLRWQERWLLALWLCAQAAMGQPEAVDWRKAEGAANRAFEAGRFEQAAGLYRSALRVGEGTCEVLGGLSASRLIRLARSGGTLEALEREQKEKLARSRGAARALGLNLLARLASERGAPDEAAKLTTEALGLCERAPPGVRRALLVQLGFFEWCAGQRERAAQTYRRAGALAGRSGAPDELEVAMEEVLRLAAPAPISLERYRAALELMEDAVGSEHWAIVFVQERYAQALKDAGEPSAEATHAQSLAARGRASRRRWPPASAEAP